ncbi:unnamed protein product [Pedinophyceae sp. YPF-701]|nr:unnamed protein product [Pedinophyceae sp. YPF-701]
MLRRLFSRSRSRATADNDAETHGAGEDGLLGTDAQGQANAQAQDAGDLGALGQDIEKTLSELVSDNVGDGGNDAAGDAPDLSLAAHRLEHLDINDDKDAEVPGDPEKCAYCGIGDPRCLVQCVATQKWFCNGRVGTGHACIVHHMLRGQHKDVRLHRSSPLGDSVLECSVTGARNAFNLGFVLHPDTNKPIVVARSVLLGTGAPLDVAADFDSWEPVIVERQFVPALVAHPSDEQVMGARRLTPSQLRRLEAAWKVDPNATAEDLPKDGETASTAPLEPVPLRYSDAMKYEISWKHLVEMDRREAQRQTMSKRVSNLKVTWVHAKGRRTATFVLPPDDSTTKLRVADQLTLTHPTAPGWAATGAIVSVDRLGIVELRITEGGTPPKTPQGYTAQPTWIDATYRRMEKALGQLAHDKKCMSTVLQKKLLRNDVSDLVLPAPLPADISAPGLPPLNGPQQDALRAIVTAPLALIQGPPGTGKTVTSATLVYQLCQLDDGKLLVTAPSNVAVDHLAERISRTGVRVSRMCARSRESVLEENSPRTRHLMTHVVAAQGTSVAAERARKLRELRDSGHELSKNQERNLRKIERKAHKEVLSQVQVVCCTCAAAGDARLDEMGFHRVIVDEATQATEPECLLPIVKGARQLVLVGDHCQLGPVCLSQAAARAGLNVSLFERLLFMGMRPHLLAVQYRMHPALAQWSSEAFYEGCLRNGVTEEERTRRAVAFPWPGPRLPMMFVACTGFEEMAGAGTSYVNRHEAKVVEEAVMQLLDNGVQAEEIGVITPYAGQRTHIEMVLARPGNAARAAQCARVEVASVDAFQGREKDYIILSCVRSNERKSKAIGFVNEPRRLNVALTRARYGLVVIGNPTSLSKSAVWSGFLTHMSEQGCLVDGPLSRGRLRESLMPFTRRTTPYQYVPENHTVFREQLKTSASHPPPPPPPRKAVGAQAPQTAQPTKQATQQKKKQKVVAMPVSRQDPVQVHDVKDLAPGSLVAVPLERQTHAVVAYLKEAVSQRRKVLVFTAFSDVHLGFLGKLCRALVIPVLEAHTDGMDAEERQAAARAFNNTKSGVLLLGNTGDGQMPVKCKDVNVVLQIGRVTARVYQQRLGAAKPRSAGEPGCAVVIVTPGEKPDMLKRLGDVGVVDGSDSLASAFRPTPTLSAEIDEALRGVDLQRKTKAYFALMNIIGPLPRECVGLDKAQVVQMIRGWAVANHALTSEGHPPAVPAASVAKWGLEGVGLEGTGVAPGSLVAVPLERQTHAVVAYLKEAVDQRRRVLVFTAFSDRHLGFLGELCRALGIPVLEAHSDGMDMGERQAAARAFDEAESGVLLLGNTGSRVPALTCKDVDLVLQIGRVITKVYQQRLAAAKPLSTGESSSSSSVVIVTPGEKPDMLNRLKTSGVVDGSDTLAGALEPTPELDAEIDEALRGVDLERKKKAYFALMGLLQLPRESVGLDKKQVLVMTQRWAVANQALKPEDSLLPEYAPVREPARGTLVAVPLERQTHAVVAYLKEAVSQRRKVLVFTYFTDAHLGFLGELCRRLGIPVLEAHTDGMGTDEQQAAVEAFNEAESGVLLGNAGPVPALTCKDVDLVLQIGRVKETKYQQRLAEPLSSAEDCQSIVIVTPGEKPDVLKRLETFDIFDGSDEHGRHRVCEPTPELDAEIDEALRGVDLERKKKAYFALMGLLLLPRESVGLDKASNASYADAPEEDDEMMWCPGPANGNVVGARHDVRDAPGPSHPPKAPVECAYCGIGDPRCLVQCVATQKWFCNGRVGTGHACIVHHMLRGQHKDVRLHRSSPLGDSVLECCVTGARNAFNLGFVLDRRTTRPIVVARSVVHARAQDLVEGVGLPPGVRADPGSWEPAVVERQFARALVARPSHEQVMGARRLTHGQMRALEAAWKVDPNARVEDLPKAEEECAPAATLEPVPLRYADATSYETSWRRLLELDCRAAHQQTKAKRVCNLTVTWAQTNGRGIATFVLPPDDSSTKLHVADQLTLTHAAVPGWTATGSIVSVDRLGHVKLRITQQGGSPPGTTQGYSAQPTWIDATYRRMEKALAQFVRDKQCISTVLQDKLLRNDVSDLALPAPLPAAIAAPGLPPLNGPQQDALRAIVTAPLALIQGPPGTGKTVTSATLVYQLCQLDDGKLLVTAPSNVAVDHLAERISRTGVRVSRMCARSRESVLEENSPRTRHLMTHVVAAQSASVAAERARTLRELRDGGHALSKKQEQKLRKSEREAHKEVLADAQVVCCTCAGAGDARLDQICFRRVIVDEATQATEPECLLPIVKGARQLVLVGDHCQLGPVCLSQAAARAGLNVSLFERLLFMGMRPHLLAVQYRMHPALAQWSSEAFYEGCLRNGVTEEERTRRAVAFPWPGPRLPMMFVACAGFEEMAGAGTSYVNRHEAKVVEEAVMQLLDSGVQPEEIGVITPYAGQRTHIEMVLARPGGVRAALIEVASVDAFQGREKDYIILSCVRSNAQRGGNTIGFVKDPRRLNVALTRARYGLVVIGNPTALSKSAVWSGFLTHMSEQGCFVDGPLTRGRLRESLAPFKRRTAPYKYVPENHAVFQDQQEYPPPPPLDGAAAPAGPPAKAQVGVQDLAPGALVDVPLERQTHTVMAYVATAAQQPRHKVLVCSAFGDEYLGFLGELCCAVGIRVLEAHADGIGEGEREAAARAFDDADRGVLLVGDSQLPGVTCRDVTLVVQVGRTGSALYEQRMARAVPRSAGGCSCGVVIVTPGERERVLRRLGRFGVVDAAASVECGSDAKVTCALPGVDFQRKTNAYFAIMKHFARLHGSCLGVAKAQAAEMLQAWARANYALTPEGELPALPAEAVARLGLGELQGGGVSARVAGGEVVVVA